MKVLIIDDSPDLLTIAKARLAGEGLEVVCADNGSAGLAAASEEEPDLILLDIDMPDKSGFEVCRILKADDDLRMIPVVFLTRFDDKQHIVKGLDLGAVDYVTKPFDAFELRARVRAALRTKHLQDLLIQHAQLDPLTELPNRLAMNRRLQGEWERRQRHGGHLAFIMADIDHFKKVNDACGHIEGDRVLRQVAAALAGQCRQTDSLSRYGGDEFAIIVPCEDIWNAGCLAERCRREIAAIRVQVRTKEIQVTASFGVADATTAGLAENLVADADAALYTAKAAGGDNVKLFKDDDKAASQKKKDEAAKAI